MENTQAVTDNNQVVDNSEKRHLLSDETYQLLINAQEVIFNNTDVKVALRKLLDKLITKESIEELTQQLVDKFKF